jgi:DNA polymerase-3 subunit chi|tara:strand:+ start:6054 stop:6500 length:447 start_codon:yes stop_codon:yes gene_type:complete
MSEVFFYHLTKTTLEIALPKILERALSEKWSIEIRTSANTNLDEISNAIWRGPEESFLPHCLEDHEDLQDYPIVLCKSPLKDWRDCLIVVGQADLKENEVKNYKRICLIFDAKIEAELSKARKSWKKLSEEGINTAYWAEDKGRWVKK